MGEIEKIIERLENKSFPFFHKWWEDNGKYKRQAPGMYDLTKLENNAILRAMVWKSDQVLPKQYELRNRGLVTKVSEIDIVRQFALPFTLGQLVEKVGGGEIVPDFLSVQHATWLELRIGFSMKDPLDRSGSIPIISNQLLPARLAVRPRAGLFFSGVRHD